MKKHKYRQCYKEKKKKYFIDEKNAVTNMPLIIIRILGQYLWCGCTKVVKIEGGILVEDKELQPADTNDNHTNKEK